MASRVCLLRFRRPASALWTAAFSGASSLTSLSVARSKRCNRWSTPPMTSRWLSFSSLASFTSSASLLQDSHVILGLAVEEQVFLERDEEPVEPAAAGQGITGAVALDGFLIQDITAV